MADKKDIFERNFQIIRRKFIDSLEEKIPKYKLLHEDLVMTGNFSSTLIKFVHEESHKISGTAATFNFPKIGKAASEIENMTSYIMKSKRSRDLNKKLIDLLDIFNKEISRIIEISAISRDEARNKIIKKDQFTPIYNILVIDDDPLVGELLESSLSEASMSVKYIADVENIFSKISQSSPHLIILDVNIGRNDGFNDGFEVLKKLKEAEDTKLIPVIILSKRNASDDFEKGMKLGAADYLSKPFDTQMLIDRIMKTTLKNSLVKVLVADDDKIIVELLEDRFKELGHEVTSCYDGLEAFEKIKSVRPNIAILDISMPGMDGMSLLKKIRSTEGVSDIPIVLLSGKNRYDIVEEALESGADDYITKPVKPEVVAAKVKSILKRKRLI